MITISHLTMRLAGGGHQITILDDVTLEIPDKQRVAIVGPSGSGKSTLLGLIAGLDRPTSGSIALNGVEISTMRESALARYRRDHIGYIFQSFHLIPTLTALENVLVPLELAGMSHGAGSRDGTVADRRPGRATASLSRPTVGRRATAGGGGQSLRLSPTDSVGRRADRQLGFDHGTARDESAPGSPSRLRHHLSPRHARSSHRLFDGARDCVARRPHRIRYPHRHRPSGCRVFPVNRFILRMAWRETRGAWRHFLYFFACIAIGVGALVGVSLFGVNMERAVTKEARGLLGGDLEIRLTHPLSLAGQAVLNSLGEREMAFTHVSELIAMAARTTQGPSVTQSIQIIELKAVESAYPLYGAIRLDPAQSLDVLLHPDERRCGGHACFGAVVQESLLIRMGLSVGDRLKIGQAMFLITGVVRTEPDRMANAFTLGPRVMIAQEGLSAAELIKPGSRVRERYLVKMPADMPLEPLLSELRDRLAADSARVSSYRTSQSQLRQFLEQLSRYLGLIGLTALFIGGLGVGTSIHAFLRDKLRTIAILKAVGADSATVVSTYVVQAIFLGCVGSLAGILLGIALQRGLPPLMAALFVSDLLDQLGVSSELSWSSVGPLMKGAALGLLSTLLFTLWPLLKIRDVHPGAIFRRDAEQATVEHGTPASRWWVKWGLADRWNVGTAGVIILGLCALSVWQAGSWSIGFLFLGALSLAITILFVCARMLRAWAGLDADASRLEPSLCPGQCRAAGEPGDRDHGRHRHRRDGDCHGIVGGTGVAQPNTGESPGGCPDIFLYRHSARSSAGVRVVG